MKRLWRIIFNVATALSLLMCGTSAAMWAWNPGRDHILATLNNPQVTSNFYLQLVAVLMPYWLAVLFTAILPLIWMATRLLSHAGPNQSLEI